MTAGWKRTVAVVGGGLQLLWRIRLGWLMGHGLLVLTHVGRHTGKQYRTVLYVQRYDDRSREATVISVWGDSQWFRNISAKPAAQVEIGLQRYAPTQRFLNAEEIVELEKRFRSPASDHRLGTGEADGLAVAGYRGATTEPLRSAAGRGIRAQQHRRGLRRRRDVIDVSVTREVFFSSGDVRCAADWYSPDGGDGDLPCVVMGHTRAPERGLIYVASRAYQCEFVEPSAARAAIGATRFRRAQVSRGKGRVTSS